MVCAACGADVVLPVAEAGVLGIQNHRGQMSRLAASVRPYQGTRCDVCPPSGLADNDILAGAALVQITR